MAAIIMDGKALAAKIKGEIRAEAATMEKKPGLAVILVGNDPASRVYVTSKRKDCEECGFFSEEYALPERTSEEELLAIISQLNARDDIDGVLCQLPLPDHINEKAIITAISPEKDVDGFHPMNMGALMVGKEGFLPCTPYGVMEILKEYEIEIEGKECVVVGRSKIVGKPMSLLLLQENGTVTICHSRTKNLAEECRRADILISAVGEVDLIREDMVKPGAVVVDVAMNHNTAERLCGDVDYEKVKEIASAITPVPGGVGPMTRAMLMKNTLLAARKHGK